MEKFIYVFSKEARDVLLKRGYLLLNSDDKKDEYVFANREEEVFDLYDLSFVRSNSLTL